MDPSIEDTKGIVTGFVSVLWTIWFGLLLFFIGLPTVLWVIVRPLSPATINHARFSARVLLRLTGWYPKLYGFNNFDTSEPSVVICNHNSYLDGLVVFAFLPPHFRFVIKKEMQQIPLIGRYLEHIGSLFVERNNPSEAGKTARQILGALNKGHSVVFFAEGTRTRPHGIGAFKEGPFVLAARKQIPIIPMALTGTRQALKAGQWLARPSQLVLQALPTIECTGSGRNNAQTILDKTRQAILSATGEPDLAQA